MQGEGDPGVPYLAWRSPLGPYRGAEANCKGLVTSRRERPFRRVIPNRQGPAGSHPRDPDRWGLPGGGPQRAPQALSSLQVGPAGSLVTDARSRGPRRLGRVGRALPGLLSSPPLPAPASPHSSSEGEPETRLLTALPQEAWRRCPSAGLSAAGAAAGLARLKHPGKKDLISPGSLAAVLTPALESHVLVRRCGVMMSSVSYSNFVFLG